MKAVIILFWICGFLIIGGSATSLLMAANEWALIILFVGVVIAVLSLLMSEILKMGRWLKES